MTGSTPQIGMKKMNSKIVETLEMMCDKENPQDRKLLLLAELVETKCDALAENQHKLNENLNTTKEKLSLTNTKLDRLTEVLENNNAEAHNCPVHKNKEGFEKISILVRYPKLSLIALIGIISLLAGALGNKTFDLLKWLFGV